jgi:phage tail sheath protein FI
MAFQVSPGVLVQEKDLTRIIPAVSTSIGAFAGEFRKGPLDQVTSISSEQELVQVFGKPDNSNFEDFFTPANFLQYSNALRVVRAQNTGVSNATVSGSLFVIKNTQDYQDNWSTGSATVGEWAARTAGAWGNTLKVSVCHSATGFQEDAKTTLNDSAMAVGHTTVTVTSGTGIAVGDILEFSKTASGTDYDGYKYRVTSVATNDITFVRSDTGQGGLHQVPADGANVKRLWEYFDAVSSAPGTSPHATARLGVNDEMHIVVVDEDGLITGTRGEVLEVFDKVSKASDAKSPQGDTNYYADVIYNKSSYIYWTDHHASGSNHGSAAAGITFSAVDTIKTDSLQAGADGSTATTGQKKTAYEMFEDSETVDVGLIMGGKCDATHVDDLISLAEKRKDAIAFVSPQRSDVAGVASSITPTQNVLAFCNGIRSSSYVMIDSGYKYMYDRYNDVYRYVPLNGDIAGLAARTDLIADSWFSPAGYNRGVIRGAVKLAYNPKKSQRDELYKARVNPVVTFPGQGTILFGDKTGLSAPSAFDRINVRRLFIVLEKAIATASKFQLFEFNDEFTRANFRNIVEPFLREVQGRRGITDFLVVCDESNNTGEVIDRNEFIAEIFIKPARSINFITLQFIATRTGVSFEEVAGG